MPHYHRDLFFEQSDIPNLHVARAMAIAGIRDVLAREVWKGTIDLGGQVNITDDSGAVLKAILFADAELMTG